MIPARFILLSVLFLTPWCFGAVHESTQVFVFAAVACACLCWLVTRRDIPSKLPLVLLVLLAAVALGLFQLWAMPKSLALLVAPQTVELRDDLLVDQAAGDSARADQPPIRYTMSLRPAATRYDLSLLVLGVAGFVLGSLLFCSPPSRVLLCWIVAVNGALLAFFGLLQKLTWNGQFYWIGPAPSNDGSFASFVNRNNAGGYLNLCLAGAIVLMLWAANRQRDPGRGTRQREAAWSLPQQLASLDALKIGTAALAAIIVGAILSTLSRGAGIALLGSAIVTALAVMVTGRKQLRTGGGLIVLLAGVGLVGWVGLRDAMVERFGTLAQREQLVSTGRVPNWSDALRSVADFWPTGSGLGTYRDIYLLYQERFDSAWYFYAENQYVQAIVEAGIPGLLLLLLAIAAVVAATWSLLRSATDPLDYALAIGGLFAVSSQAIHSFFDFGLYLPANLLLMAVFCGVVTQRAANVCVSSKTDCHPEGATATEGSSSDVVERATVESGHPKISVRSRRSSGSQWESRAVELLSSGFRAGPKAVIVLVGSLLIGVVLGAWQVRTIAARNSALIAADFSTSPAAASEADLRAAIDALQARLPASADDAELHYELAKAWIYLHRNQVLNELRRTSPPSLSLAELWDLASSTALHKQAHEYLRAGKTTELAELRNAPLVSEHLVPALQHLRRARQSCPILAKVHLRLARLCWLDSTPTCDATQTRRARRLAPSDPYTFVEAGLLDLQAGRFDNACQSWQHALTVSNAYLDDVLAYAVPGPEPEKIVEQVLPASPTLLLRLAKQELPGIPVAESRPLLLRRVELLASGTDVPADVRHHLLASVYALRGENAKALSAYENAVELRPLEFAWRYEYGQLLFQEGRLDEAHEQIRWCARRQPESPEVRALLGEIHKSRLSR